MTHVCRSLFVILLVTVVGTAQDKSAFDKLDPKKVPAALRPKGTPADVMLVLGEREGRYDSIAVRPDGGQMAIGGPDGLVRIWDLGTLKQIGSSPLKEAVCLAYSTSGKTLVVGDSQGNLKYLSIANGRPGQAATTVGAHKGGPIWSLVVATDGKTLYSAGDDKQVKAWDISAIPGKLKATLPGHTDRVRGLAVSPDGKWLASTSDKDKTIRLWELGDKPAEKHVINLKAGAVSVAFSPDSSTLAAGCQDGALRVFKLGGKPVEQDTVSEGKGNVFSISFAPDGKSILALVKWDQKEDRVFVWDLEGKPLYEGKHGRHVEAVAFDPGGRHVVIVNETSLFVVRLSK